MHEWNEIDTDADIEKLGSLHDSVIVSVEYHSGCAGNRSGLTCWTEKDQHTASVIIDHSWTGRIELLFTGVRCCVISGFTENYTKEIYGCNLFFRTDLLGKTRDDRLIVWTDGGDISLENLCTNLNGNGQTVIIAERLKWRYIEKFDECRG